MAYTVALTTGAASQNEGNPIGNPAASFTFTVTRGSGDVSAANYAWRVISSADGTVSTDFAANTGVVDLTSATNTITITALNDSTVEPSESFTLALYRPGESGFVTTSAAITLVNDDSAAGTFAVTDFSAAELQTVAATLSASGGSGYTYGLVAGGDAALFSINSTTGVLSFLAAPNFEAPGDAGANNVYDLTVRATDSGGVTTDQAITVTVTNVNEAVTVASGAAYNVVENTTPVTTLTSTDIDANDTATWSISGGADSGAFTINSATGALSFTNKPNFESPTDADHNNTYLVNVTVTDSGGLTDTKALTVTVTDNASEPPVITSNGGNDFAVLSVAENTATTTTLTTVTSTFDQPPGTVAYSVSGPDAGAFTINSSTGVLTFAASPDYESPTDANGDNLYDVNVVATGSNAATDTQRLFISVTNVSESTDGGGGGGGFVFTDPGSNNSTGGIDGETSGGTGGGGSTTSGGGGGASTIAGATSGNDSLTGNDNANVFAGGDGNDVISGLGGNDTIDGDNGNDLLLGGGGDDFIRGLGDNDTIDGGDGNDTLNGNLGADIVVGGAGADSVMGGQGDDAVYGGTGNDVHVNGNIGNDTVHGEDGDDMVFGGQGNDFVYGDAGNDTVSGDLGDDNLFGGSGADRFVLRAGGGHDWVGDFNAAEGDLIQFSPGTTYTVGSFSNQVVLTLSTGETIGLTGVAAGSFSASWVVFA